MCPLCIGSALYLLSGTGSAGGAAAIALRSISRRQRRASSQVSEQRLDNAFDGYKGKALHIRQVMNVKPRD